MIMEQQPHQPVLLTEVMENIQATDGKTYIDGTFGAGGYSRALLSEAAINLYSIDCDPNVEMHVESLSKEYPNHFHFVPGKFGQMDHLMQQQGISEVDGIVLDIGVSSMQLDQGERGFSFMQDGPLDMRMSQSGMSAEDVVNQSSEKELADIIYQYGDERKSRAVARAIVKAREEESITTTRQLAEIVRKVVKSKPTQIDPATRTFQALRIWVNDELGELKRALQASERLLKKGGRLLVVSFHSLEDKIVKHFINERIGRSQQGSRYMPPVEDESVATFKWVKKGVVEPQEDEINRNIRARSAKLRIAEKIV
jgi:16S rRNA (cytosine1402-N4)-methyltransferase